MAHTASKSIYVRSGGEQDRARAGPVHKVGIVAQEAVQAGVELFSKHLQPLTTATCVQDTDVDQDVGVALGIRAPYSGIRRPYLHPIGLVLGG